jgi:hypothetical protein
MPALLLDDRVQHAGLLPDQGNLDLLVVQDRIQLALKGEVQALQRRGGGWQAPLGIRREDQAVGERLEVGEILLRIAFRTKSASAPSILAKVTRCWSS